MSKLGVDLFHSQIVHPTLEGLALHRTPGQLRSACQLLTGIALHESGGLVHRVQVGGPALGLFQMEPATFDDLFDTYLDFRHALRDRVLALVEPGYDGDLARHLVDNDRFACACARMRLYRSAHALPEQDDLCGHAAMWKAVYNTRLGKGTEERFIADVHHHARWLYPGHVWDALGAGR